MLTIYFIIYNKIYLLILTKIIKGLDIHINENQMKTYNIHINKIVMKNKYFFHTTCSLLIDTNLIDKYKIDTTAITTSNKLSKSIIKSIKRHDNKFNDEISKMDDFIKENSSNLPDSFHERISDLIEKHSQLEKWIHNEFNKTISKTPNNISELIHYKQSMEITQQYKRDKIEEIRHEEMMKLISEKLKDYPESIAKYLEIRNHRINQRKEYSLDSEDAYTKAKEYLLKNNTTESANSNTDNNSAGPSTDPNNKSKSNNSSLLDDYANTSTEMPEYFGTGDD